MSQQRSCRNDLNNFVCNTNVGSASSVNHGHVMQEGMEEHDPDESLKSLQTGQQTPISGSTTNSNYDGQEFHSPIKQLRIAPILLVMQRIDAVTTETPNAARIDAAIMETPNTSTAPA